MSKKDDAWMSQNFPSPHAREAADKAIDKLDPSLPMTAFIDAWIAAYSAARGRTSLKV